MFVSDFSVCFLTFVFMFESYIRLFTTMFNSSFSPNWHIIKKHNFDSLDPIKNMEKVCLIWHKVINPMSKQAAV